MQLKFGENLKLLRQEKDISQPVIAKLCNTTVATVSRWENGVNEPDLKTVLLLADFFEITTDDLLK